MCSPEQYFREYEQYWAVACPSCDQVVAAARDTCSHRSCAMCLSHFCQVCRRGYGAGDDHEHGPCRILQVHLTHFEAELHHLNHTQKPQRFATLLTPRSIPWLETIKQRRGEPVLPEEKTEWGWGCHVDPTHRAAVEKLFRLGGFTNTREDAESVDEDDPPPPPSKRGRRPTPHNAPPRPKATAKKSRRRPKATKKEKKENEAAGNVPLDQPISQNQTPQQVSDPVISQNGPPPPLAQLTCD